MAECEHIIGFLCAADCIDVITLKQLKKHIEYKKSAHENSLYARNLYEPSDYSDMNKDVDIERFNYCPKCGEKIDWENLF